MEHTATIDIELPVRTIYDQWTQFTDFPLFMNHVESITQIDPTHVEWNVKIFGVTRTWVAEITEQSPDQRIAWTSTDGTTNSGVVTFHALSDTTTRVMLQMMVDPDGFLEKVADWGGFVSDRLDKDLVDFKEFILERGQATGDWRGTVDRPVSRQEAKLRETLIDLSKDDLVDRASAKNIDGRANMTRDELIEVLVKA